MIPTGVFKFRGRIAGGLQKRTLSHPIVVCAMKTIAYFNVKVFDTCRLIYILYCVDGLGSHCLASREMASYDPTVFAWQVDDF